MVLASGEGVNCSGIIAGNVVSYCMFVALGPSVRLWYYIVVREVRPKTSLLLKYCQLSQDYRGSGRSLSAEIKGSDRRGRGWVFFFFCLCMIRKKN